MRRAMQMLLVVGLLAPAEAAAAAPDTTERTIQDTDGDHLLEFAPGENHLVVGGPQGFRPPRRGSILNFLQLTDFQMVDEESPARVEFLDTSQRGPFTPFSAAYRPQESLTTQITEAMVRAVRGSRSPITGKDLALTILTGDNADSQQYNETRWFIDILDGRGPIDPDSGIASPECPHSNPGSAYDGVQGDDQYYDPDRSGPNTDGPGYSPDPAQNGAPVRVRDFPGLFDAANRPFPPRGLGMPWYTAFGNHDALVQGNSPYAYTGPFGTTGESFGPDPQNLAYHEVATGCFKASSAVSPSSFIEPPNPAVDGVVPPDPGRCFLAKDEPTTSPPGTPCQGTSWIEEHFLTTGTPVGHGFAPASCQPNPVLLDPDVCAGYGRPAVAAANHDGYYSFSPVPGLRFAVLDTVTDECGAIFCSEGSIDDAQFRWLDLQLQLAELSGEYAVVFGHHTLRTTRWPSTDLTEQPIHYGQRIDRENPMDPQGPESVGETLEELFCRSPQVLAYVAGHEHGNRLQHFTCDGPQPAFAQGPGDFWEVTTAAHIDWPQQARMIELIDNRNGTMSLVLTMFDHAGPPRPGPGGRGDGVLRLASIGRELAYNDYQHGRDARGEPEDRNAIIVIDKPWPNTSG